MNTYALSVAQVRDMMLEVCDAIIAAEATLAKADRDIGDGDHGIGMSLGFSAAKRALTEGAFADVYEVFSTVGKTLISSMGGASGIIFGMMFYAGTKNKTAKAEINTEDFYHLFADALTEIQYRGKAQVGDKTMIDALHPMVESMAESVQDGLPLNTLLDKASTAAEDGMERSKKYVAKFGKAKTLGERSIGYPDAGAVSVTIIAKAMHQWIQRAERSDTDGVGCGN